MNFRNFQRVQKRGGQRDKGRKRAKFRHVENEDEINTSLNN